MKGKWWERMEANGKLERCWSHYNFLVVGYFLIVKVPYVNLLFHQISWLYLHVDKQSVAGCPGTTKRRL